MRKGGVRFRTQEGLQVRTGRIVMKLSLRGIVIGALGAAALCLSPLSVSPAGAITVGGITLNADRVQIIHGGGYDDDSTNFNITFTNFGEYGDCGTYRDAIASGVCVALSQYTCPYECATDSASCLAEAPASIEEGCGEIAVGVFPTYPFEYFIAPFVDHVVNHEEYGTFFGLNPVDVGPGTVSARIVLLSTPPDSCGMWELNVEATGLDLAPITHNPMSIWLNDAADDGPFCFDIDNAIIGGPISSKPTPVVRRGVRK
jgi:hypothetical protein